MRTALVVVGDGRGRYLERAMRSVGEHLPDFDHRVLVDDSGDADYAALLRSGFPGFLVRAHRTRRGLAAAVRTAWEAVPEDTDYVFHMEEDFVLTEPAPVERMARVLDRVPELAQMTLVRQAWNEREKAAGGLVGADPEAYMPTGYGVSRWTEHRRIFSLNPSLIPGRVVRMGWPDGNEAEFTRTCLDAGLRFALWGRPDDPPRCLHIGAERSSGWAP